MDCYSDCEAKSIVHLINACIHDKNLGNSGVANGLRTLTSLRAVLYRDFALLTGTGIAPRAITVTRTENSFSDPIPAILPTLGRRARRDERFSPLAVLPKLVASVTHASRPEVTRSRPQSE